MKKVEKASQLALTPDNLDVLLGRCIMNAVDKHPTYDDDPQALRALADSVHTALNTYHYLQGQVADH